MNTSLPGEVTREGKLSASVHLRNIYISAVIVVVWVVLFWQTIVATVTIWIVSETFAHGFIVLPVVIWLLWRDKRRFLAQNIESSLAGMALSLLFILLWLTGQVLEISVFAQLGVFGGVAASHWMIFGNEFAKRYKFPLCYLVFAVPMGNTLIPLLQHVTAKITVFLLTLSQIPVYYEGLYITIPSGSFEVAEACSGIRYLIASLAVGTLYAYLSYRKLYKQMIFLVLSLVIPVLANGIRAYLIVIIAHLSDLKYATGVDHLIYGWLFFGVVIFMMFYLGGFFADNEPLIYDEIVSPPKSKYNIVPIALVVTIAVSSVTVDRNIESLITPATPELLVLPELSDFSTTNRSLWGARFNDSFAIFYGANSQEIELYIAQYANRQTRGELVTSVNWYYDKNRWSQTAQTHGELAGPDKNIRYIDLQLVNSRGRNRLVRYWYFVNNEFIADKAKVKLSQALLALANSQQPVFFIAVSTLYQPGESGLSQAKSNLNRWIIDHPLTLIKER